MDGQKIISLYIHIPFCISKCSYCDFFSLTLKDCNNIIPREYIAALCKEIKYRLNGLQNPLIKTIYIGGGTPSLLKDFQIKEIVRAIKEYPVAPDCEFTLEVNPDDLSRDLLVCLEENGVNRLSCGIFYCWNRKTAMCISAREQTASAGYSKCVKQSKQQARCPAGSCR